MLSAVFLRPNFGTRANQKEKIMQTLSLEGWSSIPEYSRFVPSYVNEDGKVVDDKYTTFVMTGNGGNGDDGDNRKSYRVNFWGALARSAKEHLMDKANVAHLRIKNARVSPYIDSYERAQRFSLNVNSESEYEVVEIRPWTADGNGFHSLLAKVQNGYQRLDKMDEMPF
jgi:hypothetical protein